MKIKGSVILLIIVVVALLLFLGFGCNLSCGNKEGLLLNSGGFVVDSALSNPNVQVIDLNGQEVSINNTGDTLVLDADANIIDRAYSNAGGCFDLYACNGEPMYGGRKAFELYNC